MKNCVLMLFVIVMGTSSTFGSITIIENTPSRLVFDWHLESFDTSSHTVNGTPCIRLISSELNSSVKLASTPSYVPSYSFYVGVPQQGAVTQQFMPGNFETITLPYQLLPDTTSSTIKFNNQWISEPDKASFRGLKALQFFIRPFSFNPVNRVLTVCRSGRFSVDFPASARSPMAVSTRSDYWAMIKSLMVNFDVAKNWGTMDGFAKRQSASAFPLTPGKTVALFTVGDGHSGLNEGTINENGLMKISASQIERLLGVSLPISNLRVSLYASHKGELDTQVPGISQVLSPESALVKIPLLAIDMNKNGMCEIEDYFLAYVAGASDFRATSRNGFDYEINRYDDYRHYWLMVSSTSDLSAGMKRFVQPKVLDTVPVTTFFNRVFLKKSRYNATGDENKASGGKNWIMEKLITSNPEYHESLQSLVKNPTGFGNDSVRLNSISSYDAIRLLIGNSTVCGPCGQSWQPIPAIGTDLYLYFTGHGDESYQLLSIDLKIEQQLTLSGLNKMTVFSVQVPGVVTYRLSNPDGKRVFIVRIPHDSCGESQVSYVDSSRAATIVWSDTANNSVRYMVSTDEGLDVTTGNTMAPVTLPQNNGYIIRNVRDTNQADYLIITHESFLNASKVLAGHKYKTGKFKNPRIVCVSDIYREFSGGSVDPSAIRNMLVYATRLWNVKPDYAVLMGLGTYDYRGVLNGTKINAIPVYESGDQIVDDFYGILSLGNIISSSTRADVIVGRIPCNSQADAENIVNKIIETEDPVQADYGAWRNRLALVADDDMQLNENDGLGNSHYAYNENLETIALGLRPSIEIKKIYLFDYPWDIARKKPGAASALIGEINKGVAFVNYYGHGGIDVWADERVLEMNSPNNMSNLKRYPLFTSFSCDVGRFDGPFEDCLSDQLVRAPHSGAIISIACSRSAQAGENQNLGEAFYKAVFDTGHSNTMGTAFEIALANNWSQRKYTFLGDPSIRLINNVRNIDVSVRSADNRAVDSIKALQNVSFKGFVRKRSTGEIDREFGTVSVPAFAQVGLYNPATTTGRKDGGPDTISGSLLRYRQPGSPVFTARTSVVKGEFYLSTIIPKNVVFTTPGVRLIVFAWQGDTNGLGHNGSYIFSGTDTTSINDVQGPVIAIAPIYANESGLVKAYVRDGISVSLPLTCGIKCSDEHGIDVVGSGPDEGLTLEVTGIQNKQNINHLFNFDEGDFKNGTAIYTIEKGMAKTGLHAMIVSARDLLGNISKDTFNLTIVDSTAFTLGNVFNYPNPMRMHNGTHFFFNQSQTDSIYGVAYPEIFIRIYSLSGKMLRLIHEENERSSSIFWDGRDQTGRELGPNIYLYQVIARSIYSGITTKSKIQKLVIHPPK